MKRIISMVLMAAAVVAGYAQDKLYADEFPLGDVTLLDGPLKKARNLNIETLLQYDCDRLLAPYRKEAGLEPRAKTYPMTVCWRPTARRRGWNQEPRPIPTGTGSTATWVVTT